MKHTVTQPGHHVGHWAEQLLTGITTLRREEAIALTPRATVHPALRGDDPKIVRDFAAVIKADLYDRTGDFIDFYDVALPLARTLVRMVEQRIEGGLK